MGRGRGRGRMHWGGRGRGGKEREGVRTRTSTPLSGTSHLLRHRGQTSFQNLALRIEGHGATWPRKGAVDFAVLALWGHDGFPSAMKGALYLVRLGLAGSAAHGRVGSAGHARTSSAAHAAAVSAPTAGGCAPGAMVAPWCCCGWWAGGCRWPVGGSKFWMQA